MNRLTSVGLDVGTSTTQLIVSELTVENRASQFSVPDMEIAQRKILYKSPIHFTPLLDENHVDGEKIREIVSQEYRNAGIRPQNVDTGAIIITGETSRKENAAAVLAALESYAGEFVVATAGPDLESVLAAKGAGAVALSEKTGRRVLHMDIGGGTSNLALIADGNIIKTGCVNVGGRLLKLGEKGEITYISPVLKGIFPGKIGEKPSISDLTNLAEALAQVLEMAAGLRPANELLAHFVTQESSADGLTGAELLSFSGGVADCIEKAREALEFGDIGPLLGRAIRESRLCAGAYRLGGETIRATVIGAGCHSTQLSGSTVYFRGLEFPMKNLPVGPGQFDGPSVLALPGPESPHYGEISAMAEKILAEAPQGPILVALQADCAKALGQALALRCTRPILCIDRVQLKAGDYLDVGAPVGSALPVVIKTLILQTCM